MAKVGLIVVDLLVLRLAHAPQGGMPGVAGATIALAGGGAARPRREAVPA